MSQFIQIGSLDPDPIDDGKLTVSKPFIYRSDFANMTITVPIGFVTDLASVPRLPIIYLLAGDTSTDAAIIHDYCYSSRIVPRDVADKILLEASAVTGVPAWRRYMMYLGVRIGGASHYDK